ncbi:MAG: DNA-binding response regulator, partial [Aquifex sp.]
TDIIFITAYNEYAMQAFKYAAFDFLTKPIDPENLRNTIERYKTTKRRDTKKISFLIFSNINLKI